MEASHEAATFFMQAAPEPRRKEGGSNQMSVADSLLVALFLMAVVFVALFALYLFIELFSLTLATVNFSLKHKRAK